MKSEKRLWNQGKQKKDHELADIMKTATTTYKNLVVEEEWSHNAEKVDEPKKGADAKCLALAVELKATKESTRDGKHNSESSYNIGKGKKAS